MTRFPLLLLTLAPLTLAPLTLAPLTLAHAQTDAPVAGAAVPAPPTYDEALDRAFALGALQVWDEARASLNEALKLARTPDERAYVYGQLGATFSEQKRYDEAAQQFRLVLNLPDAPDERRKTAHLALATSLRDAESYEAAGREANLILGAQSLRARAHRARRRALYSRRCADGRRAVGGGAPHLRRSFEHQSDGRRTIADLRFHARGGAF